MSAAAPALQPGTGVSIFGRRVSWDAIVLAGATLLGIFFAYNLNKNGSSGLSLGVPAAAQPQANPTLPDPSVAASTVSSDPSTAMAGGGVLTSTATPHVAPTAAATVPATMQLGIGSAVPRAAAVAPQAPHAAAISSARSIVARLGAAAPGFRNPPANHPTTVVPKSPPPPARTATTGGRHGGPQYL